MESCGHARKPCFTDPSVRVTATVPAIASEVRSVWDAGQTSGAAPKIRARAAARVQPGARSPTLRRRYDGRPRVHVARPRDRPQQRRGAGRPRGSSPRAGGEVHQRPQVGRPGPVQQRRPARRRAGAVTPPARRPTYAGSRSKRSRLPRSVHGCPAWANSQSSRPVTSSESGSTSRFLGLRSLCTRQVRRRVSSRSCASSATSRQPASSSPDQREPVRVRGHPVGQVAAVGEARRWSASASTKAPGAQHRHPARAGRSSTPSARPPAGQPGRHRGEAAAGRRAPRQERRHQQPGQAGGRVRAADLEHLRHRHQPAHQPQHGGVDLGGVRSRAGGSGRRRSGPRCAPRRTSPTKVSPRPPPASGVRSSAEPSMRRIVPRPHYCVEHGPSSGPGAGHRPGPCASGVAVDEDESRQANGPDWDRYADEYQATHGAFLGDAGFVWGPEGHTEDERRRPRRRRPAATCSRSAAAPASARAGCARTAAARSASTCPSASCSTRRRSTTRRGVPVPSVLRHRHRAPASPTRSFDVVFSLLRRPAVRRDIDAAVARGRPGAAPGRPLRLLGHPPDALDVPRRPRRGRPDGHAVLLGPHALRRGRRRERRRRLRRAPPHARRLGARCSPAPASAWSTSSSPSGPRTTTGSGAAGHAPAAC